MQLVHTREAWTALARAFAAGPSSAVSSRSLRRIEVQVKEVSDILSPLFPSVDLVDESGIYKAGGTFRPLLQSFEDAGVEVDVGVALGHDY